tara:strand:- start:404 stop:598 length:195 start_codon:yes stop_codon:yes gene_type:complete
MHGVMSAVFRPSFGHRFAPFDHGALVIPRWVIVSVPILLKGRKGVVAESSISPGTPQGMVVVLT